MFKWNHSQNACWSIHLEQHSSQLLLHINEILVASCNFTPQGVDKKGRVFWSFVELRKVTDSKEGIFTRCGSSGLSCQYLGAKAGGLWVPGQLGYMRSRSHRSQKTTIGRQLRVTPASDSCMFWCYLSQSSWKSPLYACEGTSQKEITSSYYDGNSLFLMIATQISRASMEAPARWRATLG